MLFRSPSTRVVDAGEKALPMTHMANPSDRTSIFSKDSVGTGLPSASKAPVPAGRVFSAASRSQEGNSLRVDIDTPKTQNVTVTVFDANGMLVRHLFHGTVEAGEHYLDWDGKDELGNGVLPGDYTVVLELEGRKMSGVLKVIPK